MNKLYKRIESHYYRWLFKEEVKKLIGDKLMYYAVMDRFKELKKEMKRKVGGK